MKLTDEIKEFIEEHKLDDMALLLLKAKKYPHMDIPFIAGQILAKRQVKDKLPFWYKQKALIYPSKISVEQCSSECTARYKQELIADGSSLCDMTGGLGVDSYYFSGKAKTVFYVERFSDYCEAARNNFEVLNATNIQVIEADSASSLQEMAPIDVFYIDPARRAEDNKRVFALQDCEPDLLQLKNTLLDKAPKIIAKISPMADIQHTLSLLPETKEVHVLSVRNECKELLFVLGRIDSSASPVIHCINFKANGARETFCFTLSEEQQLAVSMAKNVKKYLYEPNASILKAGAFKRISDAMGAEKLHTSSHLYTSDHEITEFPGRQFLVENVMKFNGKLCATLNRIIPQANITTRNFPLTANQLRIRSKIKEGGAVYLFATTIENDEKVLIQCSKIR